MSKQSQMSVSTPLESEIVWYTEREGEGERKRDCTNRNFVLILKVVGVIMLEQQKKKITKKEREK